MVKPEIAAAGTEVTVQLKMVPLLISEVNGNEVVVVPEQIV